MKSLFVTALLACTLFAAPVNRGLLNTVETSMNKRIRALNPTEEFLLLGLTHGVYLEGYGCVFTATVNLAEGPGISPFRQQVPEPERAALRKKKLERLPALRDAMREMLVNAAGVMDPVPTEEKLVMAVKLFHHPHEDSTGLPAQIVMQAPRRTLLSFQTQSRDKSAMLVGILSKESF